LIERLGDVRLATAASSHGTPTDYGRHELTWTKRGFLGVRLLLNVRNLLWELTGLSALQSGQDLLAASSGGRRMPKDVLPLLVLVVICIMLLAVVIVT